MKIFEERILSEIARLGGNPKLEVFVEAMSVEAPSSSH